MIANKRSTDPAWTDPDDAPDLSSPEWAAKMTSATVRRGRPKATAPKVSTTIRLEADVLAKWRATGNGWQTRMGEVLKKAVEG